MKGIPCLHILFFPLIMFINYGSIYNDAVLILESVQTFYCTELVCLLQIIHLHHEHSSNSLSRLFVVFFFITHLFVFWQMWCWAFDLLTC